MCVGGGGGGGGGDCGKSDVVRRLWEKELGTGTVKKKKKKKRGKGTVGKGLCGRDC